MKMMKMIILRNDNDINDNNNDMIWNNENNDNDNNEK